MMVILLYFFLPMGFEGIAYQFFMKDENKSNNPRSMQKKIAADITVNVGGYYSIRDYAAFVYVL